MQDEIIARSLLLREIHNEKEVAIRNSVIDIKVEKPGRRRPPSAVTENNNRIVGNVNLLVLKVAPLYLKIKYM